MLPRISGNRRRLILYVLLAMVIAAAGAVGIGYAIFLTNTSSPPLGAIALVVAPAVTLISTLSTVLGALVRGDSSQDEPS